MSSRFNALLGLATCLALGSVTVSAQDVAAPAPAADPVAAATPAAPVPEAKLSLSNKWRLEVSEGANNDGTLLFRFTPDQVTAELAQAGFKLQTRHDFLPRQMFLIYAAT